MSPHSPMGQMWLEKARYLRWVTVNKFLSDRWKGSCGWLRDMSYKWGPAVLRTMDVDFPRHALYLYKMTWVQVRASPGTTFSSLCPSASQVHQHLREWEPEDPCAGARLHVGVTGETGHGIKGVHMAVAGRQKMVSCNLQWPSWSRNGGLRGRITRDITTSS